MNKYMPRELQNLKDSKERVMQNVELAVRKKQKVKPAFIIGTALAAVAAIGITFSSLDLFSTTGQTGSDPTNPVVVQEGEYDNLLRSYFAPDRTQKVMLTSDGEEYVIETHWLSPQYVVEMQIRNVTNYTYYRVANNQIEIVYATSDAKKPHDLLSVNELDDLQTSSVVVKAPFTIGQQTNDFTLVEINPSSTEGKQVLVLERNDQGLVSRFEWEQGMGLIYAAGLENDSIVYTEWLGYWGYIDDGPIGMRFEKERGELEAVEAPNGWTSSPNGKYQVMNSRYDFEGVGEIYINEVGTDNYTKFSLTNVPAGQVTPKDIVWIDNERLFVIIGNAHGTVTVGGELYLLDVVENRLSPVVTGLSDKEEVSTIFKVNDSTFRYEKVTFLSDMMDIEDSKTTQDTIEVKKVNIVETSHNEIHYTELGDSATKRSKVHLVENNDPKGTTLEDLTLPIELEIVKVGAVVIHLNRP